MAIFSCKVMTPHGQVAKLRIEEKDKIECLKRLKRNGMTPIEVKEGIINFSRREKKINATIYSKKKRFTIDKNKIVDLRNRVSIEELRDFTKSLYLLKESNFTESHSLATIINDTKNEYFKTCLREILKNYDNGTYIYKTMRNYPKIFPTVYVNFIKTGELTGTLEESLKHANRYLEDEKKMIDKIRNNILPNVLMFFGMLIILFVALLIGIPSLQKMIISNGGVGSIPKTTLVISEILNGFLQYWYVFVIIISIMLGIIIRYVSTDEGRNDLDSLKYSIGMLGKMVYLMDFARIIKSVYLNLQNNMRVQDALEISKNVTSNTIMHNTIEKAINNIYISKSWLEPFEQDGILSPIIIELLKKGFQTKSLDIIDRTINYLDNEVEDSINKVLKRLLEISYLIIGIALILFIFLVFIPYIKIYLGEILFL